jgi:membrane-bound serine protease (ClpP class)
MIEIYNPGAIFPGVVGAIALVLGLYSMSVLPVNYAGVALLGLAALFFVAEIKVQSYGLLSVAGVTSLVLGSLMLFKSADPALRVSLDVAIALAVVSLLVVGGLATLAFRARSSKVRTGEEGMVGESGLVRGPIVASGAGFRGKVAIHGELWNAVADRPIGDGEQVRVAAVEGLRLEVVRVAPSGDSAVVPSESFGSS